MCGMHPAAVPVSCAIPVKAHRELLLDGANGLICDLVDGTDR
jgi:hypothetical protein